MNDPGAPTTPEAGTIEKPLSKMSLEEYAKTQGIEIPPIELVCLPCRHSGQEAAQAVITNLRRVAPDLVLYEETYGAAETDFRKRLESFEQSGLMNNPDSSEAFSGAVLRYLIDSGIEVKPLNGKFETEAAAGEFSQKMTDTFDFTPALAKTRNIKDDEAAWNFIQTEWDMHVLNIVKLQRRREEDTVTNIAPTILSSPHIKNIRKVAVVFGSDHTKAFFEPLKERGDTVSLVRDAFTERDTSGDFSSLKSPSFFLWSMLAPFGGEIASQARSLYEFEKTFGQQAISEDKAKELFMKLRHGTITPQDVRM